MQIKGKRAVVTGDASDLGLTICRELLRNGVSTVVMIDIQESAGRQAMENLNAEFGRNRALFLLGDATNNTEFDAVFKEAVVALGGLDILINNAGVVDEADFAKAIDVNVTATVRGTLLGLQQMRKDSGGKGGVIVNISSTVGLYAASEFPVYSATKHAVVSFSRSFAQPYHYQGSGVRIVVLCSELMRNADLESDISDSDVLSMCRSQRMSSVAHGLVYVVRCAQNGSVWISEEGKPVYEIQLSDSLPLKTDDIDLEK